MMLPIYINYDWRHPPIGTMHLEENELKVKLNEVMTRDEIFNIFGNAGISFKENITCSKTGKTGFLECTIQCWSFGT